MNPVLVLAEMPLVEKDWSSALRYYQTIEPTLQKVSGFLGVGLWRDMDEPTQHLVTYAYATLAAAEEGLEVVASKRLLTEATVVVSGPADVTRVSVVHKKRSGILSAKVGQFLSKSVRHSGPGYGDELVDELDRIFDELALLPGYLAAEVGRNDTLPDEVIGLAAWESEAAFKTSLPPGALYSIKLYRRIF